MINASCFGLCSVRQNFDRSLRAQEKLASYYNLEVVIQRGGQAFPGIIYWNLSSASLDVLRT